MTKKIVFFAFLFVLLASGSAKAELSIDITGARSEPMAIGLPEFSIGENSAKSDAKKMAQKIARVIEEDLSG